MARTETAEPNGQKLRQLRINAGLGPKAFAQQVHCHSGYLWQIETGKVQRISVLLLNRLAGQLGVTADALLREAEDQVGP